MPRPMRDLVVLIPGILGSELWKGDRLIWGFPEGLRGLLRARSDLRKAVDDLKLQEDDPLKEDLGDGVQAKQLVSIPRS